MTALIEIRTAVDSQEAALELAHQLIELRVAACVQVLGPMVSVYRWRGQLEQAEEWICLIKTLESAYSRVEAAINEAHPYDVPEILAVPVARGLAAYGAWVRDEVAH
jgi:periplasmic divalent cation tolerance protein